MSQVGIDTTSPATTLHLYNDSDYPVLRLEGVNSIPNPKVAGLNGYIIKADSGMAIP